MKEKIEALMKEKGISFSELSTHFTFSKQTLTRKINGTLEWTYTDMMILADVFGIQDVEGFFFT
jgi:lambda repressor-like predicted transcriptional regulator